MRHLIISILLALTCATTAHAESLTSNLSVKALQTGGGQEAGGLGAQADLFSGAATHTFGISVPPGPGGLKPSLGLSYNSQRKNANSYVGYGWELELGSIERTAEDDGRIDYEGGTKFAARLAGQVLTLVRTETAANPADYGISSYAGYYADIYQANVEEAFNVYVHVYDLNTAGNIEDFGWFVKDKSGTTYEFGTDLDRYATIESEVQNDEDETIAWTSKWNLVQIEDVDGNTILIDYNSYNQPTSVDYGTVSVEFNYTTRVSFPLYKQYQLSYGKTNKLIESIEINVGGATQMTYDLSYAESQYANHSLLTSIMQTAADGVSLPTTTFEYYDIDPGTFKWSATANDFSGSRSDCSLPSSYGYVSEYTLVTDMNGDALPDLVLSCGDDGNDTIKVLFNNGNDFEDRGATSDWTDPLHDMSCDVTAQGTFYNLCGKLNAGLADSNGPNQTLYLIDMNGDTLPDRVMAVESPTDSSKTDFAIAFNTGAGFATSLEYWRDPVNNGVSDSQRSLLDMNGDGLVDRVNGNNDYHGFNVYFNYGAGFKSTEEHWTDPISLYGDTNGHADIYSPYTGNTKNYYLMDFNGDGYIDRFRKVDHCHHGEEDLGACLSVELNREGHEWALPDFDEESDSTIVDGIDNLGFIDPISDSDQIANLSPIADWMDFNGDGFVDRVEGDHDSSGFKIYFFDGTTTGGSYDRFEATTLTLDDPISDADKVGYITYSESLTLEGAAVTTFVTDMNGDGYPDRVHADGTTFHVYTMIANELEFSDVATSYDYPAINQPPLALKSIDDGRGGRMAIEYIPTAIKRRDSDNRFLPFPVYTVHKLYHEDASIAAGDGTVEYNRNPGMRYVTYDYYGGNFYVREAIKATSDVLDETLTTTRTASFNGFGEVVITSAPLGGETWDSITDTTIFHQALGDIHTVSAADEVYYDANAYLDLARSGRIFKHTRTAAGTTLLSEALVWDAATLDADLDIHQITLATQTTTVTEPSETNSRRTKTAYEYDANGNATVITAYDKNDAALVQTTNAYFDESSFDADLKIRNRIESSLVSLSGTTYRYNTFAYDSLGHITSETEYADATTAYTTTKTYDSFGNVKTITGADGVTHTLTYDTEGMFVTSDAVALPSGSSLTTNFENDRFLGGLTKVTENAGNGSQTEYDGFGRPTAEYILDTALTPTLNKGATYTYDDYTVDAWSAVTLLKTEVWQPQAGYSDTDTGGSPTKITYANTIGQVLQSCDYTERGNYRLVQYRTSNGGRTSVQTEPVFSSDCDFIAALSPGVDTITRTNDVFSRPTALDFPAGDADSPVNDFGISYTTNADGHLVKTISSSSGRSIITELDDYGRLAVKTDPNGNTLTYSYTPAGDMQSVTDTAGTALVSVTTDWLGRKLTSTEANLGTWRYEFNSSGQLFKQTDNKNQRIEFEYDSAGRILRKNTYTAAGSLDKYIIHTYDTGDADHDVTLGELYKIDEYDSAGNITRSTKQGYDADYRYTSKITRSLTAGDFTQTIATDYRGNETAVTFPGGVSLYYQYDRLGTVKSICSEASCATAYYTIDDATGFDEFGRLLMETYGNGVTTNYTYFANSGRLANLVTANSSTQLSARSFTYDAEANITAIADSLGQSNAGAYSNLAYDDLDRLMSFTPTTTGAASSLSYASNGNITTNALSYGSDTYQYTSAKPHAVTQIGARSFSYDDNGNMTSDLNRVLTYDAENQLTQVAMTNGTTAAYEYDFTGKRVKKAVTRTDTSSVTTTSTTEYLGDAIEVRDNLVILNIHAGSKKIVTKTLGTVSELLGSGGATLKGINITPKFNLAVFMPLLMTALVIFILRSFKFKPLYETLTALHHRPAYKLATLALAFLVAWQTPAVALAATDTTTTDADFFYYHHGDFLGSSHLITEGNTTDIHSGITYTQGDIIQRFEYYPFGGESFVLNPNLDLEVSFTGQDYDDETGLYYYNARYYDPQLARFIQADTVIPDMTDYQAYNRYSYVVNNPLKYTDPSGHCFIVCIGGGGGGNFNPDADMSIPGGYETDPFNGANPASLGGIVNFAQALFFGGMAGPSEVIVYDKHGLARDCDESGRCPFVIEITKEEFSESGAIEIPNGIYDSVSTDGALDSLQTGLDIVGLIPGLGEIADGANALIYVARGDYVNAGLSAMSMVPFAGVAATVGKWGKRGVDAVQAVSKYGDEAVGTTYVIGRKFDTAVAKNWPGHEILDVADWTLKKNDDWIQGIVQKRGKVYMGSPISNNNIWDAVNNRPTVYSRELEQLMDANYKQVGDYLMPPGL